MITTPRTTAPRSAVRRSALSRRLAAVAALAVASLALTGCIGIPRIASGPTVETHHEVSDAVHALRLENAGDVEVKLGDEPGLTVRAPQSVSDRLTVRDDDGTLVLGIRGAGWTSGKVDYVLTVRSFDALELEGAGDVSADFSGADRVSITVSGAGDVRATGIDAGDATITITGAGDVRADGVADTGELIVTGSGTIDAEKLELRQAVAEITGAGDIRVHASDTLDAHISGFGDIRISGGARVTSEISGLGEIVED